MTFKYESKRHQYLTRQHASVHSVLISQDLKIIPRQNIKERLLQFHKFMNINTLYMYIINHCRAVFHQ